MALTRSRLVLALAAGALLPAALYAQQSTGSLSGHITAADGVSPKANVVVTVVQKSTNLTRKVVSDSEGNWRTPSLPVGDYKINLEAGGQNQIIYRSVNLGMDTLIRFKWPTETGAVVVVEALATGVDQVNTTSAEIGVNVDSQILANMPVLDRNVNSAAVLAPGVSIIQGSQVDPTKKTSTYIVSGEGNGRGTNFNVDGADNNSSDVGGSVLPIPFDAIDQFQVVTNQYKAEFGRSNAGFMNVVTKSGSNDEAGVLSYQYTNQNMRASRTDENPKLSNNQSIYAALVSGPIIKDKLFYMVATERTSATTGQTFDPRAVAVIPSLGSENTQTTKMNLYAKLDWNISQQWLASFKYARYYDVSANQSFPHTAAVNGYVDPSMLGTNRDSVSSWGAKLTGTFGNIVWESTLNTFNYINSIRPSNPGPSMGTDLEVRSRYDASSADSWRQGQDPNAYQNTGVKRGQWKNEITYTLPEHNIKGGMDLQKTDYPFEKYFWANPGIYVMSLNTNIPKSSPPIATGVNFANAWNPETGQTVNGITYNGPQGSSTFGIDPSNISRAYVTVPIENPAASFRGYGFYAQDDWTLNNNWSVYAGARLDWDTQLDDYSQYDNIYAQMHAANPLLAGIGSQAPRTHKYGSPRIQILYKPNGDDNLVFKLGLGKFVASTIDNVVGFSRALGSPVNGMPVGYVNNNGNNFLSQANGGKGFPGPNGTTVQLPADLTPYNYANNVNGLQTLFNNMASQLSTASFQTGGKELLPSDFAYPTTQTLTFGVTYKFSDRSALDMTFLYSKTKNQTIQYVTDGSAAQVWSPIPSMAGQPYNFVTYSNYVNGVTPPGASSPQGPIDQGDSIFLSNQHSSDREIQVKYTYSVNHFSFLATFVAKEIKSTSGGSAGSFDSSGGTDFYGAGYGQPWAPGAERLAAGTEPFSGAFSLNYAWDCGTKASLLGQWHSGKYYDIFLGYSPAMNAADTASGLYGPANNTDAAHPDPVVGTGVGAWNLDLGFRISQDIKFGHKMVLQPFLQVQNLLNNYDYGTNYQNTILNPDGSYNQSLGQRYQNFQSNAPRTAAIGARFTW